MDKVYITIANAKKIVSQTDLKNLNLSGEIYKIPIYFLSKYEKDSLLAIQELLKDPEKYFNEIYVPFKPVDTFKYVYEGRAPSYHADENCSKLHSNYQNFEIPDQILKKGEKTINEFRKWFEEVKHLLADPPVFVMRLHARWGIESNPRSIEHSNSGTEIKVNLSIEAMEDKIDSLLRRAGSFFNADEKNKIILRRFGKYTFAAYKSEPLSDNYTGYSDEEVKKFLRDYDSEFKKPLKALLIEYYKLKLNPNIEMKGEFLQKLGFKPCGFCITGIYKQIETVVI